MILLFLVPPANRFKKRNIFGEMRRRGDIDGDSLSILRAAYRVAIVLAFDELFDAVVAVSMAAHCQKTRRVAL